MYDNKKIQKIYTNKNISFYIIFDLTLILSIYVQNNDIWLFKN